MLVDSPSALNGLAIDRGASRAPIVIAACYKRIMSQASTTVEDFAVLYRQAFKEFGVMALWNKQLLDQPTPGHALVVARALRIEGNLEARRLAERIEQACRAAV